MSDRRRIVAVSLVVAATFLPFVLSGLLLDDYFHLEPIESRRSGGLEFTIDASAYDLYQWSRDCPVYVAYARPLVILTFVVERALWGLRPALLHLTNIALHVVNVILLIGVVRGTGFGARTACLTGLVWGVAPHVAPAVGWISGRTELVSATMTLAAVLSFLSWRAGRARAWLALCVVFLALGCVSKENAVVAPLLILIVDRLARSSVAPSRSLTQAHRALLLAPALLYVAVRFTVLSLPFPEEPYLQLPCSVSEAAFLLVKAPLYVLASLTGMPVLPLKSIGWLRDSAAGTAFVWLAAAALLYVVYRRADRSTPPACRRVTGPLVCWMGVALLPYSILMATSLYLYLPLMGMSWLLAAAFAHRPSAAARAWIIWLVAVGIVGNVTTAAFVNRVSRAVEKTVHRVAYLREARSATDVLLLDAPLWTYALPAAVRLRRPDIRFRTHFVNFAPGIFPGAPSALEWQSSRRLILTSPYDAYYRSSVERFLLFGADPLAAPEPAPSVPFRVSIPERVPHPRQIQLELTEPAGGRTLILQFDGWRLEEVTPPDRSPGSD